LRNIIGQVDWHEIRSPNGFALSNANPNQMEHTSLEKASHLSLMYFKVIESTSVKT